MPYVYNILQHVYKKCPNHKCFLLNFFLLIEKEYVYLSGYHYKWFYIVLGSTYILTLKLSYIYYIHTQYTHTIYVYVLCCEYTGIYIYIRCGIMQHL